ncbi:GLEYA adhesin domain [Cordyceps militaris CM01]|uniref:GLEYA adhesin domain n=1 Tax=Cordyceps militaris (strain CM01) TaxID=983644 RepID=G3JG49_CORMM|nr:GLEYA adhesin domain [Cordyceps militaris CM01]EGX92327.1 GLEYA adhesin domain [Cordyceps militaris CM01]
MARLSILKALSFTALYIGAAALDLRLGPNINDARHEPQGPITTVTIPYLGDHTTSTVITHCGITTVVVETPLISSTCSSTTSSTTTSTTQHPTSTSTSTSIHTTTHVPTTTSTSTSTTSSTSTTVIPIPTPGGPCPLIKPGCAAAGLNIDSYPNPFTGYSREGSLPWSYYITQRLRPLASSLTNVAFFPQDTGPPAPLPRVFPSPAFPLAWYAVGWTKLTNGGVRVDANNFTLVYAGFYRAPETGRYALCSTADNENDVFFGHGNAFSCLDGTTDARARPLVVSTGGNYINGLKCAEVDLVRGAWYPLRSVMGNWQGPSAFNLTIKTPSQTFEQRRNDFSGLAYPRSCGLFL